VTLDHGQSLTVMVMFSPTAAQTYTGSLVFALVGSYSRRYQLSASLSGTGVQQQPPAAVAPSITSQPVSQTITSGQTATFSVAATGTPPLTYQWTANGAAISGATTASYTTPATTISNSGSLFGVTVSNSAGSLTSNNVTLTVNAPPPAPVPPTITTQPVGQTVAVGQTATFSVVSTGTAPLTYQWNRDAAAISGATSASYTTAATTASSNGSTFTVVVTNSYGNVTSNAATLTVNPSPTYNYSLEATPSLSFSGPAGSSPAAQALEVWDTSPCPPQTGVTACHWPTTLSTDQAWLSVTPTSGTTSINATVSVNTTGLATGSYSGHVIATATQLTGSPIQIPVTLTITASAPTITTQPISQTITSGRTATFSVAATGTAPLTYQWTAKGAAISGATSASYTTPATTASNNGSTFSVTVSNSAGSVTSNNATLTVNAAATYTLNASPTSLAFGNLDVGTSNTLETTLTNSGNANVTISNISISGAGLGVSGASTGQVLAPGQTATLSVTFAPAGAASVTGSVIITSNATNSPTTIALSGTGVQPVSHEVTLSWTASTSVVIGYNVYRSTVSGGPYTELTTTPVATTTTRIPACWPEIPTITR
jgi:hypothetical protein